MAICASFNAEGQLVQSDTSSCEYLLLTQSEVDTLASGDTDLQSLSLLLDSYFAFDGDLFQQLLVWTLVTFISGFAVGLIVKLLKKIC